MLIENLFYTLLNDSNFFSIVYMHLNEKYFVDREHVIAFKKLSEFHLKYNKIPTVNDLKLLIESDTNISESDTELAYSFLNS